MAALCSDSETGSVKYIFSVRDLCTYSCAGKAPRAPRQQETTVQSELIHQSWVSSYTQIGPKRKICFGIVLNDKTSEIERGLCAFGEGVALVPVYLINRHICAKSRMYYHIGII